MKQLSLFRRIIFVDWHGVTSTDEFLASVLNNKKHPIYRRTKIIMDEVFRERETAKKWMRGELTSSDVSARVLKSRRGKFDEDFVARKLESDCLAMSVSSAIYQMTKDFGSLIPVLIATDNMDCFSGAFSKARMGRVRRPSKDDGDATLKVFSKICDGIICSSDIGVLKAEDPITFFGETLEEYCLGFADALLIDDRLDNCEAFVNCGGCAIRWRVGESCSEALIATVHEWINSGMRGGKLIDLRTVA